MFKNGLLLIFTLFMVAACATDNQHAPLTNLSDIKNHLIEYKNSGAYESDIKAVTHEARLYIEIQAHQVPRPALVLDIDETSLSNWPALQANDFGWITEGPCKNLPQGPCGFKAWQALSKDEAIAPTLGLFKAAKAHGVAIFFITGRDESLRKATEKNLHDVGYDSWQELIMRPKGTTTPSATDYKTPARAKIEAEGYTIIANVGDQPSDLAGGHAERTYLVPDPFYRIP